VSLAVAFAATSIVIVVGTAVGLASGYFGGAVDMGLMRLVDALMSFPFLLVVMALNRILHKPGLWVVFLVLGLLSWLSLARQVRSRTMQLRELDFVFAARALGASSWRVVSRHIFPNLASLVIVVATTLVAQMIVAESVLSYLGVGVTPPAASWGSMLQEGESLTRAVPRLTLAPGLAILVTVVGFNLLGEGLRDAFDPKG
jgi:peptide/nickel transport system permease protein